MIALLRRSKLPPDEIESHVGNALVIRQGGKVVGSAALEIYDDGALLRSVAVDEALRGQGWGVRLVEAALDLAQRRGVRGVYLLTETAEKFFPRFGFRVVSRAAVPPGVRQSVEFTTVCATSGTAMARMEGAPPRTTP